jgi:polar amino acid transport system substrate-binding protein
MNKTVATALVALWLGALLAGCNQSQSEHSAQGLASDPLPVAKIVVGLDEHFPPLGFRNDQQELVGFDIDLAREAAKRLGAQVQFKPIDWSTKEAALSGRRVDVLWNGLTITDDRQQTMAFTAPYMQNHQIIVVAARSPIQGKADLAGRVVGAQEGSTAVDAVKKEEAVFQTFREFKTFGDNRIALMDLAAGRLDAVVVDEAVGRYHVARKPQSYFVLDAHFGAEDYGVGLRKEDTALRGQLDRVLAQMKQDGFAAALAERWFGQNTIK